MSHTHHIDPNDPGHAQRVDRAEPWGWQMTIHAYGTGPIPPMEAMIEAANRAGEYVGGDEFVGVELKVVQDRPNDQAAT